MKPLTLARRGARWLVAAGLAIGGLTSPANAQAQLSPVEVPELKLERPGPTPDKADIVPFFYKIGEQRDCNYVEYKLRLGLKGDPAFLANPSVNALLLVTKMDFSDQLPAGLTVVSVSASGDATDAVGGPMPLPTIGTTTNPNDTVEIKDFRLSGNDIDGSGNPGIRDVHVRIVAKIDPAAFPAPTVVDNQAFWTITRTGGSSVSVPSHDKNKPDDGDIMTGEKTSIRIDLTDCDTPPPPTDGGEPCFEVVTGEVDCVPGGGAFIYHMPVGPDLAGKWVQVRSTTPGVTVSPALQLVPAGGGTLDWTIEGALPGDTVKLIVTGIETYAGPAEGVGLCCSQTVEIEIPEDLDCPDDKGRPDIKIEKRADVARCTEEGGCDFTITVTNVGDGDYTGPIVLDEVTLPGSAAVSSGPNAPWVCAPMTSPMQCTHPATTLNPGESVELKLGFTPGPAWNARYIRNCVRYNYGASGKLPFGSNLNDRACAQIPICVPGKDRECTPIEKKADIGIRKSALTPVCSLDGVCLWRIDVINTGTETINGPLTVTDTYPAGIPATSMFVPSPPWACGPAGPGAFTCNYPATSLVPGASIPLFVRTIVGDDFTRDQIENCAEVQAVPGETNLANNKSCAKARIPNRNPGQPGMRIAKTCEAIPGAAGGIYSCRITVSNGGTAAPSGPVRVNDAAEVIGAGTPVQVQTVTPDGAEWACGPVPADTLSCQIPGAELAPGTSRHFDVTVRVPANQRFENCARGSYGPAQGDDQVFPIGEACAQGGTTLRVEKTGDQQCEVGQPCTFEITIRNDGAEPFNGTVRIGDAMEIGGLGALDGVPITSIDPPFGCSPEPSALPIACDANLSLGAGESRVHQVTVTIPASVDTANGALQGRNCVAVLPPNTPVNGGGPLTHGLAPIDRTDRPYSCHEFTIPQRQVAKQCSGDLVMDENGRCVCPDGTTFRNGQCVGNGPKPPPKPPVNDEPPVRQCKLLPGQIRTQDGRCVCRSGTSLQNGKCVADEQEPPPVRQCKLLPGQIRTQDGRCICPRGTKLERGRCRAEQQEPPPVRQCKLLPGMIRTQDGRCVCPRGTVLANGACRKPPETRTCPEGTRLVRGRCLEIERDVPELRCPKGQVPVRGQCMTLERRVPQQINPRQINPEILQQLLPRREQPPIRRLPNNSFNQKP